MFYRLRGRKRKKGYRPASTYDDYYNKKEKRERENYISVLLSAVNLPLKKGYQINYE